MNDCMRAISLCVAMLALALGVSGCEPPVPVGFMELESSDGTITLVRIQSVSATRFVDPTGSHEGVPERTSVYLEGWDDAQVSYGLLVHLEPELTWAADDVTSCTGRSFREPVCDRFPLDEDGDHRADHSVVRSGDADGELVHASARFADDGHGPVRARVTFHFDPSDVEDIPLSWVDEI
jgi:hypothetical protein